MNPLIYNWQLKESFSYNLDLIEANRKEAAKC
jgi:hypothetical protein